MDLSQKLKQARLEAGLSQKALCGDRITRNMLSQIENGSARPSMDTLRYLAGQLGKPLSYFLEEDAVTSPNQALMEQIREAKPSQALRLLGQYKAPDPTFDRERWLLEALSCLTLAQDAIDQGKYDYARALLERAAIAGGRTPYYTEDNERRRLILSGLAGEPIAEDMLPDLSAELLLRAEDALKKEAYDRCGKYLSCIPQKDPHWHFIAAQMYFFQKSYEAALPHYKAGWEHAPKVCCIRLEDCCRETEDFAGAYFYACKLRELTGDFTKI